MTMSDGELLHAYVLEGSEAAFAALVNRYLALVHSVASRHLPDHTLSEEVTQAVFVLLARKARSLAGHPSIAGWLHRTAWQLAARTARTEARRHRRETEAAATLPSAMSMPDLPESATALPALDAALQELPAADRDALVQRYFLRKPLREVGAALGTSEAAAKMRIRRALDHLKVLLARRGITCSPAALASVMTNQGVTPVPAALAAHVISAATSAGIGAASFPQLLLGTLSLMNGTKLAVLITAAALVAGFTTVALRQQSREAAPTGVSTASSSAIAGASEESSPAGSSGRLLVSASPGASLGTAEALEAARQRLRMALAAPQTRGGAIWPDAEVLDAMAAFGSRREDLFATLRKVVLDPSSSDQDYMRMRALGALGTLEKSVPGLTSFLWETTRQGDWIGRVGAFSALRRLGLESGDLPALTRLLEDTATVGGSPAMRRFVPEGIHQAFRQNPQAAAAYLPDLVKLFEVTSDPYTRFSAASALLGTPQGSDPRVIETIRTGLREGLNVAPTDHRGVSVGIAIERAAAAGSAARPLIPDLMEVARTSHESYERTAAWLAIGQIQPELRAEIPELDQAMTRDAATRQTRQDVSQGFATHEDLVRALSDPATAVRAARDLSDTGIRSPEVIPAMIAALDGMDEDSRDQVAAAIQKLDPQASIERVSADAVLEGVIYANSAADLRTADSNHPRLERVLNELRMFHTWRTTEEIFKATRNLAALDVATAQAFVNGLAEKDPALAERARQQIAAQSKP
ncbi:MAG: sigma-70 family RNA polymerase sigma factor [Verrucomicrobia bacterium]|nr:sigma-70 family RNA polymerase sigma factor [Verrucomicrobiota bacterium]